MKLSLRKKIFLQFCLFLVVNGLIWFASYYIDHLLKQKLEIIDKKTHLLNTILEARRYEKNFFLNGDLSELNQAIDYISEADEKFQKIIQEHGEYTLTHNFEEKLADLRAYRNALVALSLKSKENPGATQEEFNRSSTRISDLGRKITEDIDQIVKEERKQVDQLLSRSQMGLVGSMVALGLLTVLTMLFLFVNVNGPLKAIEAAIHKIARGDHASVPRVSQGDEFESLVTSLNHMLDELNRRSEHLIQMEKLASLGTLTSGVAHELNNPLNNISTSVQIVLEELDDPDMEFKRGLLIETEKQVDRAKDIVKGLLEFSRQKSFNRKPVEIRPLVEKTIRMIKTEVPGNINLHVEVPDSITACLDAQRMQQVLINLIINGVHAMEQGGDMNIRGWEENTRGGFCLQIQDSGTGISEENLSRIFDPFFTTKEVGRGSGLGLSIIHGIVEEHGGHIQVDSRPETGTTFTIFLPNTSVNHGGSEQGDHPDC